MRSAAYSVVVPTIGRTSLGTLLESLAGQEPAPERVVLVDDRPGDPPPLTESMPIPASIPTLVVRSGGRGPAAARNTGWRAAPSPWVVFLDDDVMLPPGWAAGLADDLAGSESDGGVSARIVVPEPEGRRPTDTERATLGLRSAQWATADMAYRRVALQTVGGFDQRFTRAYREDADLALRVSSAGWSLRQGRREVLHPLRPETADTSIARQRGNADDALMRALHGHDWRAAAACPRGRLPLHALTTALAVTALGAGLAGRRRVAVVAATGWAVMVGQFAGQRIAAGPRTAPEVAAMLRSSAAIAPLAVGWRLLGTWRHRGAPSWTGGSPPRAVLFDRDGTLVHDVPYNGDPDKVRAVPGSERALDRLRAAGLRVGVITNQSGIARGHLDADDERRVAARIGELLGGFDTWQVCPHAPEDGCACRKPEPGMVLAAARELGLQPHEVVVIGDIGADVDAAHAAGASSVLVPTPATRPEEVAGAPVVAADLEAAVDIVLSMASAGRCA